MLGQADFHRGARRSLAPLLLLAACAHEPPPPVAPPPPPPSLPPLPRACQDLLPFGDRGGALGRSVGEVVRLLRRINPALTLAERECSSGDTWPIAYATGESPESGKPPIGFEVLRMTGDALLTFDEKDRESPTVNVCRVLDVTLGPAHRVRVVALWDSSDERAFDPARPESSTALAAWVELFSLAPSACALGTPEEPESSGDAALQQTLPCARTPLVLAKVPACPPPRATTAAAAPSTDGTPPASPAPAALPDAAAVDKAVLATHRVTGTGRTTIASPPPGLALRLERPELCLHEPAPAERDVCLAEYTTASGERWYGRGDVTRTGVGGVKNYVDSYLTFLLLRRIEAERKGTAPPRSAPPGEAGAKPVKK